MHKNSTSSITKALGNEHRDVCDRDAPTISLLIGTS